MEGKGSKFYLMSLMGAGENPKFLTPVSLKGRISKEIELSHKTKS